MTVGSKTATYAYDADGIRTKMVAGDVTYEFVTQGGKLMRETATNSSAVYVMDFIYDNAGRPFAVEYSRDGGSTFTTFYYVLNLQGDVVAITKADGTVVAKYTYDAWGNLTSLINANGTEIVNRTTGTAIAFWNPLTYRGYIRDRETGFYYLQSRYYDPANHRFINADSYASTDFTDAIACNMFAYCNNNPANGIDITGYWTISISGSGNATGFIGASIGIGIVFDDDGNIAIQWNYSIPDGETNSIGFFDIGFGVAIQYNQADTVDDLEGISSAIGFSLGDYYYGGVDVISNTDFISDDAGIHGIQLTGGIGAGLDVHINQTKTSTIAKTTWKDIGNWFLRLLGFE